MEKNKTGKYLKYAIGEIVLVVIGILIALSINNWNEGNKQKTQINSYLESLTENLKDDLVSLEDFKEQCLFRFHAQNHLLKHGGGNPVNPDKLGAKFPKWKANSIWNDEFPKQYDKELAVQGIIWIPRVRGAKNNQSAYSEMSSTGIFSSINNKVLKSLISDYYEEWNSLIGQDRLENDITWIGQWTNSLIDIGIYPYLMDDSEDPLVYVNEPKRLALLERITTSACYHTLSCEILNEKAANLIEEIEMELSNSK